MFNSLRRLLFIVLLFAITYPVHAGKIYNDVYKHISQFDNRIVGSNNLSSSQQYLVDLFKKHNLTLNRQTFDSLAPESKVKFSVDGVHVPQLKTMGPNMVVIPNTRGKTVEGDLVYVGYGTYAELKGLNLKGAIVLLEMGSEHTSRMFQQGAAGIIIVGNNTANQWSAASHVYDIPVSLPNAYIDRTVAEQKKWLGNPGVKGKASLNMSGKWNDVVATNLWLKLEGTNPTFDLKAKEAIVLGATLDTFGLVPDYSPDNRRAANVALLAELAINLSKQDRRRNIYIVFYGSHYSLQEGARFFYYAFHKGVSSLENKDTLPIRQTFYTEEREDVQGKLKLLSTGDIFGSKDDPLFFEVSKALKRQAKNIVDDYNVVLTKLHLEDRQYKKALGRKVKKGEKVETPVSLEIEKQLAGKAKWNDLRQQLNEGEIIDKVKPQYSELSKAYIKTLQDRVLVLNRAIEHNKSYQVLADAAVDDLVVSHFDFDLANTTSPWMLNMRAHQDLLVKGHVQSPVFLKNFSVYKSIYEKTKLDKSIGPLFLDSLEAPYRMDSLAVPRLRYQPCIVAITYKIPGFSLMSVGENLGQDEMPTRTSVDLSPMVPFFTNYCTGLVNSEELSLLSQLTDIRQDKAMVYTRFGGEFEGRKFQYLQPGGAEIKGPAAGAIAFNYFWSTPPVPVAGHSAYPLTRVNLEGYAMAPGAIEYWNNRMAFAFNENGEIEYYCHADNTSRLFHVKGNAIFNEFFPVKHDFVGGYKVLNAATNSQPRNSKYFMDPRGVGLYLNKHQNIKLVGNDYAVLGSIESGAIGPLGVGLPTDEGDLFNLDMIKQSARDYFILNDFRIEKLKAKNIINDSVATLHLGSKQHLDRAERAKKNNDHGLEKAHNIFALILGQRAYVPLKDISNDMIQAVVILLVLAIPFAFAFERLVFGFTSIYKQLFGFVGVFMATFAGLFVLHPAFSLAKSPIVILLAFCIVLMSGIVIYLIMGKFKGEIMALQGLSSKSHGTQKESNTALAAVLIGIAGMRNRPLKTALTAVTIILLTFTILAFASFSDKTGVVETYLGQGKGEARIEVHRKTFLNIPEPMIEAISELYKDDFEMSVRKSAMFNPVSKDIPEFVAFSNKTQKMVKLDALLGVESVDLNRREVLKKLLPNFKAQVNGKEAIYLSQVIVDKLGIKIGDEVSIAGFKYVFNGIFDGGALGSINHIDNSPIVPPDYKETLQKAAQSTTVKNAEAVEQIDTSSFLWTPGELMGITSLQGIKNLDGINLTLSLYPKHDKVDMQRASADLASMFSDPVLVTNSAGSKQYFFTESMEGTGFSEVIVPLLLGGLIIFSSLMGSIVDREKEIFTFSALGLAPPDVGMLFFAESAVYSVVGGMGGYLFSQFIAKLLSILAHYGLFTPPEMNFSSLSSISTILLVMAVVMLSTIYPAMKAGKSANPGIARKWRLPEPEGNLVNFIFPFTVSQGDLKGILNFIKEHFDNHQDASLGKFAARETQLYKQKLEGESEETYGIKSTLALAPFDLGVSQSFSLYSKESDIEGIREIVINIERENGTRGTWMRSNANFVDDLRNQFLLWRSLDIESIEHYRQMSVEEAGA